MKLFLNPKTGKVVSYPDHFAEIKPYLIEVDEAGPCKDCVVKNPEIPLLEESDNKREDDVYAKLEAMTNNDFSIGGADE